jgi:hypothetical protein
VEASLVVVFQKVIVGYSTAKKRPVFKESAIKMLIAKVTLLIRENDYTVQKDSSLHVLIGRKPDRGMDNGPRNHHVLLVEVKTEQQSNKRPDLPKLGTMLKDCLYKMLLRGYSRKCFDVGLL